MGYQRDHLNMQVGVSDGDALLVPAGTWHNLINTGYIPLKLYSIYAPPQHPHGTVHKLRKRQRPANISIEKFKYIKEVPLPGVLSGSGTSCIVLQYRTLCWLCPYLTF